MIAITGINYIESYTRGKKLFASLQVSRRLSTSWACGFVPSLLLCVKRGLGW